MSVYVVIIAPESIRGVRVCDVGSLDMAALFAAGTDFAVFHRRDGADLHLLHYAIQESQVGVDAPPVAFPVGSSSAPPDLDHSADGYDLWEEIPNTSNQTAGLANMQ